MSTMNTREVARAAVRAELAQVAFELFRRDGYDQVTVTDLAAAAGVSRSTFLRYFGSKEEAVLSAFDRHGKDVAEALRSRPADEDDWTAMRRALDIVVEYSEQNREGSLALAQLIQETPSLWRYNSGKRHAWAAMLAEVLAERSGASRDDVGPIVRASAGLGCLDIALARWTEAEGERSMGDLLDAAFAALRQPQARKR
jgi:AcrR family transcriptional regulator